MEKHIFFLIILILLFFTPKTIYAIDPPKITATSNPNPYCPGTFANIVDTVGITFDPLEPKTNAVSVQISSGYIFGEDSLTLTGSHPSVSSSWIPSEGKLKLYTSTGSNIPYADFEAAIADVKFSTSSTSPSGMRTFSINLGTMKSAKIGTLRNHYEFPYELLAQYISKGSIHLNDFPKEIIKKKQFVYGKPNHSTLKYNSEYPDEVYKNQIEEEIQNNIYHVLRKNVGKIFVM